MLQATERDTLLVGRSFRDPTRVWRNSAALQAFEREKQGGAIHHDLAPIMGAARWMKAMAEGDLESAAILLGMVVGIIDDLPSCAELIDRIVAEARALVTQHLPDATGA